MKGTAILATLLTCVAVHAQSMGEFRDRYTRQVRNLGYDGVGVETILNKWEEAFPDDPEMLVARANYYLAKSQSTEMVQRSESRYLGQKPTLTLKGEDGRDVYYFQDVMFVDSLFAKSRKYLDRAVEIDPYELRFRFNSLTAMSAYEKGSPDMTAAQLVTLIDMNAKSHPSWTLDGAPVDQETFKSAVQEYCYTFFNLGTDQGYEYFLSVSEKMNKLYPKEVTFINNIGSYWQVAKKNNSKARSFYKKALRIDPRNEVALKNMKIIELSRSGKGRP